jgi:hypothetical protein
VSPTECPRIRADKSSREAATCSVLSTMRRTLAERRRGGDGRGRKGLPARHTCSAVVEAAAEHTGPPMRMQTDGTKR